MKRNLLLLGLMLLMLASCEQKPTLQKYFVEKGEAKSFSTVDIAPSFVKTDSLDLTPEEKESLKSLHKLNVLIFQTNKDNSQQYETEKENVKSLLKTDKYEELMKFNSGEGGVSVNTKGEGDQIEEFALFLYNKESGFGVIRVLGEDMSLNDVMTLVGIIQKSNLDVKQLKPLMDMMKKD